MPELIQLIFSRCVLIDDCLIWQGATSSGYGTLTYKTQRIVAHRAICDAFHDNPDNLRCALHSCDTRACCNPKHLSWGTYKRNSQDARDRKRIATQRLTRKQAWRIKYLESGLNREIAKRYNVNESTVTRIRSGIRWSDLTEGEFR